MRRVAGRRPATSARRERMKKEMRTVKREAAWRPPGKTRMG
jgi:hypothetical protein